MKRSKQKGSGRVTGLQTELHKATRRYYCLFEHSHDAVFILDLQGRHIESNQRAADMFDYTQEEMQKLSVRELSAELPQSEFTLERLLAGEDVPLYERLFRKKGGEILPVEISVKLIRDEDGNPIYIQSLVRDISARKQDEKALTVANQQLQTRIQEVEKLQAELRQQALHDPLTGLHNRRYLDEALPREIERMKREKKPISLLMVDIDLFKAVNDAHGHRVGDQVLMALAELLQRETRDSDMVCRIGGEEFILALPGASPKAAFYRAETLRQQCADMSVFVDGNCLSVTISIGVASYPRHSSSAEEMIRKADQAMYVSKSAGRNKTSLCGI